jgi:hypothetical protein
MSTGTLQAATSREVRRPVNRERENFFFSSMGILIFGAVLFGFARTFFLAGLVNAPLASPILHIHGPVMTLWFMLFIVQASLIPAHKVKWHMRLGLFTYCVAVVMVPLGIMAATDALRRHLVDGGGPLGLDPRTFYAVPISNMVVFPILVGASYLLKRQPGFHKRLVLYASICMLGAAIDRWPISNWNSGHGPMLVNLTFILLPVVYDLVSLHHVHKATMWAAPLVFMMGIAAVPLGFTPLWHHFADFMVRH